MVVIEDLGLRVPDCHVLLLPLGIVEALAC